MAIGYGVAVPKPEPRKKAKARRKRQAAKVVKAVRATTVYNASGRCQCGVWVGEFGHAHHIKPRSLGGQWVLTNIVYLCAKCHLVAHRVRVA